MVSKKKKDMYLCTCFRDYIAEDSIGHGQGNKGVWRPGNEWLFNIVSGVPVKKSEFPPFAKKMTARGLSGQRAKLAKLRRDQQGSAAAWALCGTGALPLTEDAPILLGARCHHFIGYLVYEV